MKIKLRKPKINEKKKKQLIIDYNTGIKIKTILEKNNVSLATLYRIIKKQNYEGGKYE